MTMLKKFGDYAQLIAGRGPSHRRSMAVIGHFCLVGAALTSVSGSPVWAAAVGGLALACYLNRLEENAPTFDKIVETKRGSSFDTAYFRPAAQVVAAALWLPLGYALWKMGYDAPVQVKDAGMLELFGVLTGLCALSGIHMGVEDAGGIRNLLRRQPRMVPVWMPPCYDV